MPHNGKPHLVFEGDKFGRLVVLGFSHNDKRCRRFYHVRCECGTEKAVQGTLLRSNNTRSCGCISREIKGLAQLPDDRAVINQIILQYKRHASTRNIEWLLSYDEVESLIRQGCHYCGIAAGNLKKIRNHDGFGYNGIDRKSRELPYTIRNSVSCCGKCNIAKGKMNDVEFILLARRIAEQWGNYLLENAQ